MRSEEFAQMARNNSSDFTRDRELPLSDLILLLLNFRKGTVNSELRQFSKALHGEEALRSITPSAFCQSRMKLRSEALIQLNDQIINQFKEHFALKKWRNFRLLAVDGSTARLPNEEEITETFGGPSDANCPMARFSRLYDVLNKLVVYADMVPYETGEREIAAHYLYHTSSDDLTLYDRGYGAFWLFAMHRDMDRHYCARSPITYSNQVKEFVASGKRSQIIQMIPNTTAKAQCEEYYICAKPVKVRLIRVVLKSGQIEVLVTSLLDKVTYPISSFAKLYPLRWGVEENYKREKIRMEIENFSSRTALTIKQDFYAKIIALNLAAIMEWVGQVIAERLYEKRKLSYQINFANLLSVLKNDLIRWISKGLPWDMLLSLLSEITSSVEPIRPGRSFPRNMTKYNTRVFHGNYKRCA